MKGKRIAVFAGSFDPITNGHVNIVERASAIFDEVIFLFAVNPKKMERFPLLDRMEAAKEALKHLENVRVDSNEGYTVDYCRKAKARFLVRGIRNEEDLVYEKELASANKALAPEIETVFLLTEERYAHISSTLIEGLFGKEDISDLVPEATIKLYQKRRNP